MKKVSALGIWQKLWSCRKQRGVETEISIFSKTFLKEKTTWHCRWEIDESCLSHFRLKDHGFRTLEQDLDTKLALLDQISESRRRKVQKKRSSKRADFRFRWDGANGLSLRETPLEIFTPTRTLVSDYATMTYYEPSTTNQRRQVLNVFKNRTWTIHLIRHRRCTCTHEESVTFHKIRSYSIKIKSINPTVFLRWRHQ